MDETLTVGWEQLSVRRPTINDCSLSLVNSQFMGALNTHPPPPFFLGSYIDWPIIKKFGNIVHSPIEAPLWTPDSK